MKRAPHQTRWGARFTVRGAQGASRYRIYKISGPLGGSGGEPLGPRIRLR